MWSFFNDRLPYLCPTIFSGLATPLHDYHLSHTFTDPVVGVEKPDVEIPENETKVEVCFTLSTGITDQVIVTAMTGPKTGAANGATGMYMYYTNTPYLKMVLHMKFKALATCL